MIIATYESKNPELSPSRRWLAQIEKIKGRFYVIFHGSTEDEAREKAQKFWDELVLKRSKPTLPPVETSEGWPTPQRRREVDDLA